MTDSDDHLDERRLLASAYLDDELTADERARAEADPDVLAEVEALRSVRTQLADVPLPDAARRESAIAAAIASAGATVKAPPRPSSTARRRARWFAPVAAAAAVVVLVVGGIVALRTGNDDDEGATTGADRQSAETTAGGGAETSAAGALSAPSAAATTTAPADGDLAADTTAGAETVAEATEGISEEVTGQDRVTLTDEEDLLAIAALLQATAGTAADGDSPDASVVAACDLGEPVAAGSYAPAGADARDVEVYRLPDGTLVAADTLTCEVVLRATP